VSGKSQVAEDIEATCDLRPATCDLIVANIIARVLAALAVGRHLQQLSGVSIKKLVQTLRTARSATIDINGQRMTLDPELTGPARTILDRLETGH